jgi:uncharacterized membrane protein HdeD (DUF308 family)
MNEIANAVKAGSRAGVVWGIIVLILGILAMMTPLVSGIAVTFMVAILLLAAGLAQTVYAFKSETILSGAGTFLFGGLAVLCGLAMLFFPGKGLAAITLFLAYYFLADGIISLINGIRFRPFQGWGGMVFSGIISILLAWMIWSKWPVSGIWAVGILVGVRLVFTGWTMIILGAVTEELVEEVENIIESEETITESAENLVESSESIAESPENIVESSDNIESSDSAESSDNTESSDNDDPINR